LALRIVLFLLGGLILVIGAGAAWLIGTDDTAQTGPHDVFTPGVAIVTDAEVLQFVGPVLHLTVERDDGGPVFVGVANEVDATSYLGDQQRRVVSSITLPWTPVAREIGTGLEAVPAPGQQPWWIDSAEGSGAQELVWPISNGRYSLVVLNADGSPAVDVEVTLGLELEGAFYTALAVAVFGLALILVGLWLWLRVRRRRTIDEPAASYEQLEPDDPYAGYEPVALDAPQATDAGPNRDEVIS
jgi:hypothetical protein